MQQIESDKGEPGNDHQEPPGLKWNEHWLGTAALGFVVFFVLSGAVVNLDPPGSKQPIAFNHQIHVVENGLDCSDCHQYYEEETFSGLPNAETCAFCHIEPQGESAEEQKLVKLLEEDSPLEWSLLFRQPPHVFYSHRRHAAAAAIECNVCHGSIGESEAPPARVKQLTMEDCQDCHENEGASAECTTCHR
jgi:hypothetical protein